MTGTFSIDGEKISYKLDKVEYGDVYKLLVRTDFKNLNGQVIINSEKVKNYTIKLNEDDRILFAEIRKKDVGNNFSYSLVLNGKDRAYRIPNEGEINFIFFGKIPKMLEWLYVIFLYSGLILIVRSGLEQFKTNKRTKNFLVITLSVLLTFIMMINPLYLSYKFDYINKSIPPIQNLFPSNYLVISILWIGMTIYVFIKRKDKPVVLVTSIICLLIYLLS